MKFTLYTADCTGKQNNCFYPHKAIIENELDLKNAVSHDYVCAEFKKNYRSSSNFIGSDCLAVDCDNDHSHNAEEWLTPEKISKLLPDVCFAVHFSRSHNKEKSGKAARPRFHVLFPINYMNDAALYADMKKQLNSVLPYFDSKALDAARFFYGTSNAAVQFYEGSLTLDEFLYPEEFDANMPHNGNIESYAITEGSRNATMSSIAGRIIKRYGITDEAHELYIKMSKRCEPPLEDSELETIWSSAVKFGKKIQKEPDYIPPEEYNRQFSLKPSDYSDIGQAKVLAREYENELVYTDSTDYMRYDGTCWIESKQLAVGACEDFLDLQLATALEMQRRATDALIKAGVTVAIIKDGGKTLEKSITEASADAYMAYLSACSFVNFVMKRRDMKYVISALQAAKPMLYKNILDFDNNENLLNTPKGTVDLATGQLHEHTPNDLITKRTLVSPSDKGKDIWLDCINKIFQNDQSLIDYVQQVAGLAAIGKVYIEALIISYGEGSNGKSTFWNSIAKVLGSYSGGISADALTVGCKRNVKPEMAELKGKRLIIAAELEEGMRLSTSTVKQLCSTDKIKGEKKYKDPFDYQPIHSIVLYTNHLPKVSANDDGTWRRLIVIPFNAKLTGKSEIKNYTDYLVENAGEAILAWIIEGARKAILNNYKLTIPEKVQAAIDSYRNNNDWLQGFIDDCCEVDPSYIQKSGEFYQEYRNFCARTGEYTRSTTDFYSALMIAGYERQKTKSGFIIRGLRIKSEFFD